MGVYKILVLSVICCMICMMYIFFHKWISLELQDRENIRNKGIKTTATVKQILKNIEDDSYTYVLKYEAESKRKLYKITKIWMQCQNGEFKKKHPINSKLKIKYLANNPEKIVVLDCKNDDKVLQMYQKVGLIVSIASILIILVLI